MSVDLDIMSLDYWNDFHYIKATFKTVPWKKYHTKKIEILEKYMRRS